MSKNTIQRLGVSNADTLVFFGPLSQLIGTWTGNKGVNLIAVPDQKGEFKLLVAPYYETLTVTPLSSPTPNRGLKTIEQIPTLMYSLRIHNTLDNSLMHAENGIWELLDGSPNNNGYNLARISTIPHGDAVMALGNSSVTNGRPNIDKTLSSLPTGNLPPIFGYADVYTPTIVPGFTNATPNTYLTNYLDAQEKAGQVITSTTTLAVSTIDTGGGINNIPSINKNADATDFLSFHWIETVKDNKTGKTFQQLQYSQKTNIDFPIKTNKPDETIHWAHINVNTLIKQ
ncbi:MAG: heme-binding protein [Pyrinomonadaceae bacterium]|nr:heme-binding protein [Pyrinomonadaceae bacterium]